MSIDFDKLGAMTPVEIDTALEESYKAQFKLRHRRTDIFNTIHTMAGDREYGSARSRSWTKTDGEVIALLKEKIAANEDTPRFYGPGAMAKSLAKLDETHDELSRLQDQWDKVDEEYVRRGGWTRAFLVRGRDGHIHKSMSCSTCRPTTQFAWLTQYSGTTEAEVVEDAGMMACTVCYPSAPVEKGIPSKIEKMPKF